MGVNAGKVWMTFPKNPQFPDNDGSSGWVPGNNVMKAKADGGVIANIRLRSPLGQERMINGASAGRLMDAGAQVVPPGQEQPGVGFGGAVLNATRQTAAAVPGFVAQAAPMAVPGAGWAPAMARLATAWGAGTGADMASRGIMGLPQNVPGSMLLGGVNAAWQLPFEGAAAVIPKLPPRLAKWGLGRARPDMPQQFLDAKTPITTEGTAQDQQFIDRKTATAQRAINGPIGQARSFPAAPIEQAIDELRQRAQRYDLLSEGGEQSALDAYNTMSKKLQNMYQNKQVPGARGGTKTLTVPTISAADVDGINQYAEGAAKKLLEARKANQITDPSQAELMYKKVVDLTNGMLNKIPFVESNNMAASRRIDLKKAKTDALTRSEGRPANPWTAATHLMGLSPTGLGNAALRLNDPNLPDQLRYIPRWLGVAAADALSRGGNQ